MPEFQSPQPYNSYLPHYQLPTPVTASDAQPDVKVDPWHFATAQLLQDRNATVAKVSLAQRSAYSGPDDFQFTATGSSKREQGDKFNARTGELMSLSRAYLKLSRQLMSAARELVEPEPAPEYLVPPEFVAGAQEYDAFEAGSEPEDEWPADADPALMNAVESFNAAAEALNSATEHLRALTD